MLHAGYVQKNHGTKYTVAILQIHINGILLQYY